MDIKGTDDGLGVDQVLQLLAHGIVLLPMIPLGVFPGFPKAQSQHAIALRVRDEHDLIHKACLLFSMGTTCSSMASMVGSTSNLIFRRSASRRTSCITGNLPYAPLPITSWRHFQGMFSSTESGVWPNCSRNFLDGFFLRLEISPRSIRTSCS